MCTMARNTGCTSVGDSLMTFENFGRRGLPLERSGQLVGAFVDLALESLCPLRVVERDGGLRGQHRHQIAVGVAEAAEHAVDVGVEEAQQPLLRDQRDDERRALVERVGAFGQVAKGRNAGAARVFEPGVTECSKTEASSPMGTSDPATRGCRRIPAPAARAPRRSIR